MDINRTTMSHGDLRLQERVLVSPLSRGGSAMAGQISKRGQLLIFTPQIGSPAAAPVTIAITQSTLLRSKRDAVLGSGLLAAGATTIYLYLQPLRAIDQLDAELGALWAAEGLLQRGGSGRFQLSEDMASLADASPLVIRVSEHWAAGLAAGLQLG